MTVSGLCGTLGVGVEVEVGAVVVDGIVGATAGGELPERDLAREVSVRRVLLH